MFSFGKKETPHTIESGKILPFDVRYALEYREAHMTKSEISDLANNRFGREALYLLFKAAQSMPSLQYTLMEYVLSNLSNLDNESALKYFINTYSAELPVTTQVSGMKLAQYSRQGFELWHEKYAAKAHEAANRSNPTFIVGYSMFVGLIDFMQSHHVVQKPLHILLPHAIEDSSVSTCGYYIHNENITLLSKNFSRQSHSIIIDDVCNTGTTEKTLQEFWYKNTQDIPIVFEYIVTNKQ